MNEKTKIELALKHIENPFHFVEMTDREREAVRLASHGQSVPKTIAPYLEVTPKTVYQDLKSAADKIGEWFNKDVQFNDLTELLLKIVEGVLLNG